MLVSELGRSESTPLRVAFVGNNHYNELVRKDAAAAKGRINLDPEKQEGAHHHPQSKRRTGPWIEAEEEVECGEQT